MSKMAQDEDIDELVSSVRDFVSHKEPQRSRSRILLDRLILTPDLRVPDDQIAQSPINAAQSDARPVGGVKPLPAVKTYDKAGLEATIAELEAAVTAQFDDWEADEGESFAKAAWAASAFQTPQNDSSQETETEPSFAHSEQTTGADAPQSVQAETGSTSGTQETADVDTDALAASVLSGLDEAALRRLVAEIVHDELSGELGERITRNVRKLVRREINRVLTSREMGQV
jgi:hypothetical protein